MLGGKVVVRQSGFRTIVAKQGTSTLGHAGLKISSMSCWPEFLSPSDAGAEVSSRLKTASCEALACSPCFSGSAAAYWSSEAWAGAGRVVLSQNKKIAPRLE